MIASVLEFQPDFPQQIQICGVSHWGNSNNSTELQGHFKH